MDRPQELIRFAPERPSTPGRRARYATSLASLVLLLGCANIDSADPRRRMAAVSKIHDQTALASVALGDGYEDARVAATERLTDQAALAVVGCWSHQERVGMAAVRRITDQRWLAKGAAGCYDPRFRFAAVDRLDDKDELARVAVFEEDERHLDEDLQVATAAVRRLKDQRTLAKVALATSSGEIYEAVAAQLSDPAPLAALGGRKWHGGVPVRQAQVIANTAETDPILVYLASTEAGLKGEARSSMVRVLHGCRERLVASGGNVPYNWAGSIMSGGSVPFADRVISASDPAWNDSAEPTTRDARKTIARLKLATQEPRIRLRLPGLQCTATPSETSAYYAQGTWRLYGERLALSFRRGGTTLAAQAWATKFEELESAQRFKPAEVSGEQLLAKVLQLAMFSSEDLVELIDSKIPEVQRAAAASIRDQALLAQLAAQKEYPSARKAVVAFMRDRAALKKVALTDRDNDVQARANARLTELDTQHQ